MTYGLRQGITFKLSYLHKLNFTRFIPFRCQKTRRFSVTIQIVHIGTSAYIRLVALQLQEGSIIDMFQPTAY